MTEQQLRNKVVEIMKGWVGLNEVDGSHQKILDIYNGHKPLPRGVKMLPTYEWCAATVSAAFIKAGLADIAPVECSCGEMIKLYKAKGCWQESDKYRPAPGDVIMYDFGDTGKGDNTGNPDHVGIVAAVTGSTIKVIEGNKGSGKVDYRTLFVDGKYIRGYCLPDYAKKATGGATTASIGKATVYLPVLRKGDEGASVRAMQGLLTSYGYDTQGVDGSFGPNTLAALKKYQKAKGLDVDGICGPKTWAALLT